MKCFGVCVCLWPWDSCRLTLQLPRSRHLPCGGNKNEPHNATDSSSSSGHWCAPCPRSKHGNVETLKQQNAVSILCTSLPVHPSASIPTALLSDHAAFFLVNTRLSTYFSSIVLLSVLCLLCSYILLKTADFLFLLYILTPTRDWINGWMWFLGGLCCMFWVMMCLFLNVFLWAFCLPAVVMLCLACWP